MQWQLAAIMLLLLAQLVIDIAELLKFLHDVLTRFLRVLRSRVRMLQYSYVPPSTGSDGEGLAR
jgi:hypothetical protein